MSGFWAPGANGLFGGFQRKAAAAAVTQFVNGGDFASAAPWTLSTPASSNILAGKLNFTAAAGTRRCYQPSLGTYVAASVYRCSGVVSNYVDEGTGLQIRVGADASGLNGTVTAAIQSGSAAWPVATGPFSIDITVTTLTGQNHMIAGLTGCTLSIDDFSIVPLP